MFCGGGVGGQTIFIYSYFFEFLFITMMMKVANKWGPENKKIEFPMKVSALLFRFSSTLLRALFSLFVCLY